MGFPLLSIFKHAAYVTKSGLHHNALTPWKCLIEFSDYLIDILAFQTGWEKSKKGHGPSSSYIKWLLQMINNACETWLLWINIGYIFWTLLGLESLLPLFLLCVRVCVCVCVCVWYRKTPIDIKLRILGN